MWVGSKESVVDKLKNICHILNLWSDCLRKYQILNSKQEMVNNYFSWLTLNFLYLHKSWEEGSKSQDKFQFQVFQNGPYLQTASLFPIVQKGCWGKTGKIQVHTCFVAQLNKDQLSAALSYRKLLKWSMWKTLQWKKQYLCQARPCWFEMFLGYPIVVQLQGVRALVARTPGKALKIKENTKFFSCSLNILNWGKNFSSIFLG